MKEHAILLKLISKFCKFGSTRSAFENQLFEKLNFKLRFIIESKARYTRSLPQKIL